MIVRLLAERAIVRQIDAPKCGCEFVLIGKFVFHVGPGEEDQPPTRRRDDVQDTAKEARENSEPVGVGER